MRKDPLAPSCLEPKWPWPDQSGSGVHGMSVLSFVLESLGRVPLALAALFPSRLTDAFSEREGGVFDLTAILVT